MPHLNEHSRSVFCMTQYSKAYGQRYALAPVKHFPKRNKPMPKKHYQDSVTQHAHECHNVDCMLAQPNKHFPVFGVHTLTDIYYADTLNHALTMWADDGRKEVLNVDRIG